MNQIFISLSLFENALYYTIETGVPLPGHMSNPLRLCCINMLPFIDKLGCFLTSYENQNKISPNPSADRGPEALIDELP